MARNVKCPHLEFVSPLSISELSTQKQGQPCSRCDTRGQNLWICLYKNCLQTGCSEQYNDHSTKHFKALTTHCVHMNLSSGRIWCYICEKEVFLRDRRNSLISNDSSDASRYSERVNVYDRGDSGDSSDDDDGSGRRNYGSGLIGLQNIANTCYMNAALQALSNTPALTGFFLGCGNIIEITNEMMMQQTNQRKAVLAQSYYRLMRDMWSRSKRTNGYIVPSSILNCIRNVHPMFRGYHQHDTQEFLRCFMDQLHEELKEVVQYPPNSDLLFPKTTISQIDSESFRTVDDDDVSCSSPSLSEAEYETCDSGVSEQSSLSDEASIKRSIYSSSPQRYFRPSSPTAILTNQRQTKSNQSAINTSRSSSVTSSMSPAGSKDTSANLPAKLPHRSIISDVFDGKLLSSVQCLTCDRVSTREETFQDLSLPIPGKDHLSVLQQQSQSVILHQPIGITCTDAFNQVTPEGWWNWLYRKLQSWIWGPAVSLHNCMAAFFSADELKGDNMYSCEKCNKLRNGIKYSRVLQLPEMLCVHLKRFRHDLSYSSKITSIVHFPLHDLDMSAFLHKDCKSEISKYNLTAVICHHGTVGGGHYTSFAKHESNGRWYEYDDQLVTEVSEEVVKNCEAYVLFYRKINPQMDVIRAQVIKLGDANLEMAAADIRFYVSKQWFNKLHTFAEPGPIDNYEFLCQHGAFSPYKAPIKSHLVVPLPQVLWDFLFRKFGGGPVCNQLYECEICHRALEMLSRRQKIELDIFQMQKDVETPTIYAISLVWLKKWQRFVNGETTTLPGKITNDVTQSDDTQRQSRHGSDYAQINSRLWKFFYDTYDGGPEIILKGTGEELMETSSELANEIDVDEIQLIDDTALTNKLPDQPVEHVNDKPPKTVNDKPPTAVHQKVAKSVSFEDEDVHSTGSTEVQDVIPRIDIIARERRRRNRMDLTPKLTNSTTPSNAEIISKKDKRHCSGITTNGLFGPEGKYQASQTQLDEFVDSYRSDGVKNADANDTGKRMYEDGGLANESKCKDAEPQHVRSKISPQMTDVHASRKSYRKKHKLKHDKKKSSYNHYSSNNGETVLSDSDVN
ncbi:ubiquitin carboxyl-terminal hydrolase 20 [Bradysia coprophila]|uniref:ubiquitin carboxyl-terminal hydrolase 20 n=1 Tax=Bradysia coprophila TaxID=38358 RepID=UPI00187DA722|nr:ubiquitin carboxyl-terminal hydrolase 20 [Bradysia coprophila]